jgi:transposase
METDAKPIEPESAHTSSCKSARMSPIELITRGERRLRWTVEEKQTIAAQSLAPGVSAMGLRGRYADLAHRAPAAF